MPTADFEMNFEDAQQDEADRKLMVKFSVIPTHCEFESVQAGRPIYRDEEIIEIMIPGSKNTIANLVDDNYRRRFAKQYAHFKAGREIKEQGTPLSALVWLTPAQIMELNAVNCYTVEQLAAMSDQLSQKFMGHHSMKQRAQKYLDLAKEAAPMLKLQQELENRDDTIANLQRQIDVLAAAAEKAEKKISAKA